MRDNCPDFTDIRYLRCYKARVTFAELRRLLLDMGFTEAVTPGSHVFFPHQPSGAESPCPSTEPIGSCFLTT